MDHAVSDLQASPGELGFRARIGGRDERIWLRTSEGPTAGGGDAVLATCLMPAMRSGGKLTLDAPVSPKVLRNQREFQAVQRVWSFDWGFIDRPLEEVEVVAPLRSPDPPENPGRVAAFFSGGVDSWATVLDNPELTDLIFVRGADLLRGSPEHGAVAPVVEARIREIAQELDLALHIVETNLRDLSDPLVQWDAYFPCASMAVAHFLAPRFERVLLASGQDFGSEDPVGSSRLIDHLWGSEQLEVNNSSGRYSRVERTQRIAEHPLVRRTLRVCWENRDGAYNCGRCRKCLMTMVTLEALGVRDGVETFPPELDLAAVGRIEPRQLALLSLWEDVLDAVRNAGRGDLEPAVEAVVERGKVLLGLPRGYRRRSRPGPPSLHHPAVGSAAAPQDPALTLEEVLSSRSWRLTAPLRRAGAAARRLRRGG